MIVFILQTNLQTEFMMYLLQSVSDFI